AARPRAHAGQDRRYAGRRLCASSIHRYRTYDSTASPTNSRRAWRASGRVPMIYFDNNSTTRVFESTVDAMRPFLTERFANPASAIAHFGGIPQVIQLEKARLCKALGADSGNQFVITSGATESNNLALLGAARANPKKRNIVVSSIEHPSVMEVCEVL